MKTRTQEDARKSALKKEKMDAMRRTAVESMIKAQIEKSGMDVKAVIQETKVELHFRLKDRDVSLAVFYDYIISNGERIFEFVKSLDANRE